WDAVSLGFSLCVAAAGGEYTVCVYGINVGGGGNSLIGCRTVVVPSGPPIGSLHVALPIFGTIRVAGWAIDPDSASPIAAHVYVDGAVVSAENDDHSRGVWVTVFPGYGASHGFDIVVPAAGGEHTVCVYGINVGGGGNSLIG